jgi:hypothetical protein
VCGSVTPTGWGALGRLFDVVATYKTSDDYTARASTTYPPPQHHHQAQCAPTVARRVAANLQWLKKIDAEELMHIFVILGDALTKKEVNEYLKLAKH